MPTARDEPGAGAARLWGAAAGLPLLSIALAVWSVRGAGGSGVSIALLRGLVPDVLLWSAIVLLAAAPLAGVIAASSASRVPGGAVGTAWRIARPLLVACATFVAVSALSIVLLAGGEGSVAFAGSTHAAIGAVAMALAMIGAWCGARFRDPLDAAACALAVVFVAAGGVLVAGAWVSEVPRPLLAVGLTASPLVSMASAAHVDIVRMDTLYRISPLASLRVEYPVWYMVCFWYLLVSLAGFAGLAWSCRTGRRASIH